MADALCTVDDVLAILKRSSADADLIATYILDNSELARQITGRTFADEGAPATETFWRPAQDDTLYLADAYPQGLAITFYGGPMILGVQQSVLGQQDQDWEDQGGGRIKLQYAALAIPIGFTEAYERVPAGRYDKAVAQYTASGTVPRLVSRAVAIMSAANFQDLASELDGIASERIGDYSYTRKAGARGGTATQPDPLPTTARQYLRLYRAKPHARTPR